MISFTVAGDWAPGDSKPRELNLEFPVVINLEGPKLARSQGQPQTPAKKAGPILENLSLPLSTHDIYLTLANNHIMDFGEDGLGETLQQIQRHRLQGFCGAGRDLEAAKAPLTIENGSVRVALLSRCERQFGVATPDQAGVAPLESTIYSEIAQLRKTVDHVVVFLHGGSEMVPWPSPLRRQDWRALIEAGASAVIGNHSHVPSAWETYKNGVVFYGLGNFCVDPEKWGWHPQGLWSVTPEFRFSKDQFTFDVKTTFVERSGEHLDVRQSDDLELANHLAHLSELNAALADRRLLEALWQESAVKLYQQYFSGWLGFATANSLMAVARLLKQQLHKSFSSLFRRDNVYQRNLDLLRYHLFACDANRDVVTTALGVLSGELSDLRDKRTEAAVQKFVLLQ